MPPPTEAKADGASGTNSAQDRKRKKKKKKKKRNKKDKDNSVDPAPTEEKPDNGHLPTPNGGTPENPLLKAHQAFLTERCTTLERENFFSDVVVSAARRAELWTEQANVGEALVDRYAWAIPDERAIRILKQYSPLVEIGCGSNAYWARLAAQSGVDIVAYDLFPDAGGQIDTKKPKAKQNDFKVQKGGPEVLATEELRNSNRTLFLCYTDEELFEKPKSPSPEEDSDDDDDDDGPKQMTSLGTECLRHYTGDYIIHVGELYGDTTSMDQAPWGRSSFAAFQQQLAATFHCLLRASLPNWIHVKDTISVWKRSETCTIVFAADSDDEDEGDEEGDVEVQYRHIPVSELMPTDMAAPCCMHLLSPVALDNDEGSELEEGLKSGTEHGGIGNQQIKNKEEGKMPASLAEPSQSSDRERDGGSDPKATSSDKKPKPAVASTKQKQPPSQQETPKKRQKTHLATALPSAADDDSDSAVSDPKVKTKGKTQKLEKKNSSGSAKTNKMKSLSEISTKQKQPPSQQETPKKRQKTHLATALPSVDDDDRDSADSDPKVKTKGKTQKPEKKNPSGSAKTNKMKSPSEISPKQKQPPSQQETPKNRQKTHLATASPSADDDGRDSADSDPKVKTKGKTQKLEKNPSGSAKTNKVKSSSKAESQKKKKKKKQKTMPTPSSDDDGGEISDDEVFPLTEKTGGDRYVPQW